MCDSLRNVNFQKGEYFVLNIHYKFTKIINSIFTNIYKLTYFVYACIWKKYLKAKYKYHAFNYLIF